MEPIACPTGKIVHSSKQTAKDHAASLRIATGDQVLPYRCPKCRRYHVGHRPRGPKKR